MRVGFLVCVVILSKIGRRQRRLAQLSIILKSEVVFTVY